MWRHIASNALTFLVVAVFLLGGLLVWAQREYTLPGTLAEAICVEVPRGSNMARVSENLAQQGAISSPTLFRLGADYADKTSELKAGAFLVPEESSMQEIVDIVTRGGASTCGTEVIYRVALAEGVTSWQVVTELGQIDILEGEVAEVPAEGSLAPDSYEVSPGDSRADLIARMQRAQEVILAEAWSNRAGGLPLESPEEALILASIVEKETGVAEERAQVASVFVNRLRDGMRLQTDPTVIYGITNGEGVLGRGIRQSELRAETPYNTYVISGLPPTPIANPGRAAIEAALDPADTDYVFFVADGTGGHAFAETLEEHNQNVARWRQIEAEAAGQ